VLVWRGAHDLMREVGERVGCISTRAERGDRGRRGLVKRRYFRRFAGRFSNTLVKSLVLATALVVVAMLGFNFSSHQTASAGTSVASPRSDSREMSDMVMPTASSDFPDAPVLVPEGWSATASSQAAGHSADDVLNGMSDAYWQSRTSATLPQSVTIDMGVSQEVSALSYEPRHGSEPKGAIGQFAVRVSTDGKHFGAPIATGIWQNTTGVKTIGFAPVSARWVRLTALTYAAGSGSSVTASSLTLYGVPQEEATLDSETSADISTNPGVVGQWGATIGFPLVPVAAALLPDNQLLTWSSNSDESFAPEGTANWTNTAVLNLNTGKVTQLKVTNTDHNMFCPGVAILANGEIIVTGGDTDAATSIYNPATDSWTAGSPMNIPRGYNGMTLLSNGQAFTLGGSWSGGYGGKSAEVWSPSAGWRVLTGVPENPMLTQKTASQLDDSYGWFIATSNGEVLQAGPSQEMHWITTTGAGTITDAGLRGTSPIETEGNAVYYDTNQILTLGGSATFTGTDATSDPATRQANVISISGGTAQVTSTGSMHYPRIYSNSVVLPNNQVLVVGGQTSGWTFHDTNSVLNPELWNPTTGTFSVMAPEAEPRNYHSVAVLLPNGQVFSGGGGLCGSCKTNHEDGQIYSPPYLFNADGTPAVQPTIASAPSTATDGQTITVTTGSPVSSFSMVRYGESTHAADDDQRCIPLQIVSSSGDTYQLAIPSDPGVALPGPYMLFAIDSSGTPSVSTTLMVSNLGSGGAGNGYSQSVLSNNPAIYWPLNDASGPTASDLSGNGDTGTYSGSGVTYGASSPVEGGTVGGVTFDGSSGQIRASQEISDPSTYSESMWFQSTTDAGGYLMSFVSPSSKGASTDDHQVWMNDDGQLAVRGSPAAGLSNSSPDAYNDGNWHYVVAVANSQDIFLYVDGQLVAESKAQLPKDGMGRWVVGYGSPTNTMSPPSSDYFAGTVSDAAFSDFDLQLSQIQSQYEASSAGGGDIRARHPV
jgi:galactose oxidase